MQAVSRDYIEISPDVRAGKPRITGTRIAVEDIAVMHLKMGYSLIEIAGKYDLSLASVYSAMAYYFDHRDEIDCRIVEDEESIRSLQQYHPSRLQAKLRLQRSE
jgi:uncharacterized protein (DUF433 family)